MDLSATNKRCKTVFINIKLNIMENQLFSTKGIKTNDVRKSNKVRLPSTKPFEMPKHIPLDISFYEQIKMYFN